MQSANLTIPVVDEQQSANHQKRPHRHGAESGLVLGHHQAEGPVPYLYYSLYVILDLFSRYVVGWMVAVKESAHLAERLIEQTARSRVLPPSTVATPPLSRSNQTA